MAAHAYNSTSHGEQALAAALDDREVEYTREHKAVEGRRIRLDFAWPEVMLGAECDGANWIRGSHTRELDYERRRALALAGWTVLPYHIDEIMRDADRVAAEIVEVLSERIDRD